MSWGGAEGYSSSQSFKPLTLCIFIHKLLNNQELKKNSVEDGVSKMEAEFPYANRVGGKFDKTLEMAGRVPGKLKLSPGLNFPGRDLNFPHPVAWRIQLAKESRVTWAPAGHFSFPLLPVSPLPLWVCVCVCMRPCTHTWVLSHV